MENGDRLCEIVTSHFLGISIGSVSKWKANVWVIWQELTTSNHNDKLSSRLTRARRRWFYNLTRVAGLLQRLVRPLCTIRLEQHFAQLLE